MVSSEGLTVSAFVSGLMLCSRSLSWAVGRARPRPPWPAGEISGYNIPCQIAAVQAPRDHDGGVARLATKGGGAVVKRLALVAICFGYLGGNAMAQDANATIASAQKALGDAKSITYSGSAKDVAFQQCGANAAAMTCQGTHNPMRPITNYVRVIDLGVPASRHTGAT